MAKPEPSLPPPLAWLREDRRPRVILLGSGDRPNVIPEAKRLLPAIAARADVVLEDYLYEQDLSQIDADFVVVFGGDGSMLRAAKLMGDRQLPTIGVNLGKLGFLADLQPDEFVEVLAKVCEGEFRTVAHLMFHCEVRLGDEILFNELGLNEAAILNGPPFSILDIDLYVDSEWATTYSCDGLIVSTPIGSTAHNLSAGGPILRKNLQAFVISPISPHTLTMRPVVDSADREYQIAIRAPNEATSIVVDGRPLCRLTCDHLVRVRRAESSFQMIEAPGRHYYRTLRQKLGWSGAIHKDRPG
ncbi:NAD(+)/NADH kinase [Lignipirellula cremea]|uniref:NAD kinase n=1 Tax=Lignipirellula cremea TaxID=2528010 RepID=A0A518DX54_9BACT|nr:NAD(+)/NADH kinase [Lignipirellula cremea]QDU96400.1 putative inorganic polyphosphate/ATP-NAD kinase [Lignipirellula cremea]